MTNQPKRMHTGPKSENKAQGPTAGPSEGPGIEDNVVRIYRCAAVVKGGRRFSFSALVVVGDRQGRVGIGYGKAKEVPASVEKARQIATRSMRSVKLKGGTIPHRIIGRYGASHVVMVPASPGTGVIAGGSVRAVLELAGVHDVLTKCYGSRNPKNLVRATYEAMCAMRNPDEIERLRGVKLAS